MFMSCRSYELFSQAFKEDKCTKRTVAKSKGPKPGAAEGIQGWGESNVIFNSLLSMQRHRAIVNFRQSWGGGGKLTLLTPSSAASAQDKLPTDQMGHYTDKC